MVKQIETREIATEWQGTNKPGMYNNNFDSARDALGAAAEKYKWGVVREVLGVFPQFINCSAYGSKTLYTPLHHAAEGNAPPEVVRSLIELGAWRTLETARGERAVDIARRKNHLKLIPLLEPCIYHNVSYETVESIKRQLHDVIRSRLGNSQSGFLEGFILPEVSVLLENPAKYPRLDCAIPGFYGGFYMSLHCDGPGESDPKLVVESWSRVVAGSGRRHQIDSGNTVLVAEGFV